MIPQRLLDCAGLRYNYQHLFQLSLAYNPFTSRGSTVGVATRPRAGRFGFESQKDQQIFSSPEHPDGLRPTNILFSRYRSSFTGVKTLITHPHLRQRLRNSGAEHLRPLYAFMTSTGVRVTLPFHI
jgi:hypothetical protein